VHLDAEAFATPTIAVFHGIALGGRNCTRTSVIRAARLP
jgi:hypothetical protein